MIRYGKTTQNAIAAVSLLAEAYDEQNPRRLSSSEIAASRNLSKPIVAKVLTTLSQAGIVSGTPGPGGGYALAVSPDSLTLFDVVILFERQDADLTCPFGPGWCGKGDPCPLHDELQLVGEQMETFLRSSRFAVFRSKP